MNKTEFKNLASKVLSEAFEEHVQTWNLNEVEESQLRFALIGPATMERLANVAESYVMNNEDDNPNQMNIGDFVEELAETPDFSEQELVEA